MARQFCFLSFLSFRKSTAVATAFWRSLSLYRDSLWQETTTGMDTVLCSSCPHRRATHCFMDLEQVTPYHQRSLFAHWASRTECVPLSKRVLLLATLANYSGHILGSLSGVSFVTGKAICNLHRWLELCHRSTFCPRALLQSPMKPWGAKVSWTSSLWTCNPTLPGRQREHRMLRHSWTTFLPFYRLYAWLPSGLGCHSLAAEQCLCLHDVSWLKEKQNPNSSLLLK